MNNKYEVGLVVKASVIITEDGKSKPNYDAAIEDTPTRIPGDYVHAKKGNYGQVIYVEETGVPTIRFFPSGTATVVSDNEIEFLSEDPGDLPLLIFDPVFYTPKRNSSLKEDWQEDARAFYIDMYISKNDPGHNIEHVDAVYKTMLEIKEKRGAFDLDQRVIFMCAYLHDLFVWKNRKHHHILAANYVYEHAQTDIFLRNFTTYEIHHIADAVLEHRSSGNLKTSSEYSLLLRIADNGKPELYSIIKRIYECNKEMSLSDAREHAFKHLVEKFGPTGYIRKDKDWVKYYKEEIELLDKEFESDENLKEKIREVIC